jgi:hypothetical protein
MSPRRAHLATAVALAGALVMPGAVLAAKPDADAPPAPVVTWQKHLEHMRDMGPNLGSHVRDCVAKHGSMAGMMGPNGMMVERMAGMMGE